MKAKLVLLTVLIIFFLGFIGVRYVVVSQQNKTGQLKIFSSPKTTVFIDNAASGQTPYDVQMKAGEYLVKLIPEGEATSTASWERRVPVYTNTLTYINRELGSSEIASAGEILTITKQKQKGGADTGEILVKTDPQGSIVYLDNDEKGIAPLSLSNVPRGQHELSVFLPGFFRRTIKANIIAGYRVEADFKLAIDESQQQNIKENEKVQSEATQSASEKKIQRVKILDTPTGFLRVRAEPSINATEEDQVSPGDIFELVEDDDQWYKIKYNDEKEGWISAQYAEKVE